MARVGSIRTYKNPNTDAREPFIAKCHMFDGKIRCAVGMTREEAKSKLEAALAAL